MSLGNTITIINPDDGRRYKLNIKGEIGRLTIGRLKECLASASSCQLSPADQVIKLNGIPLTCDEDVCAVYGITNGSTLTLEHRLNVDPMKKTNMASFASPQRRALEYQTIRQQEMELGNAAVASDGILHEKIDQLQDKLQEAEKKKNDLMREKQRAERELQRLHEQEMLAEREQQRLSHLQQMERDRVARRAADLAARREQLKAEDEATRIVALQKQENERRKAMLDHQRAEYEAEKQRLAREREAYDQRAKEREIKIREKEIGIEQQILATERDRRELEVDRLVSQNSRALYYNRVGLSPPSELVHADTMAMGWADRVPSSSTSSLPMHRAQLNNSNQNRMMQEQNTMINSHVLEGLNVSGVGQTLQSRPFMHGIRSGRHSPCLLNTEDNTPASIFANHSVQCESLPKEAIGSTEGRIKIMKMREGDGNALLKGSELYDAHENALNNLLYLGQDLGLQDPLEFDANNTCVISVDGKYTLLVTFDASTERLYIYSTLLTAIPKDSAVRLRIYEFLMEGALLGREMCGGGVGASIKNDFILLSTSIYLPTSHPMTLRILTPHLVLSLNKWREKLQELLGDLESKQEDSANISQTPAAVAKKLSETALTSSAQREMKGNSGHHCATSLEVIRSSDAVGTPVLGIEVAEGTMAGGAVSNSKNGVFVVNVTGPASLAGIRPNDVVKKVNGNPVTGLRQFQREVLHLVPNTVAPFVVDRGGMLLVIGVKVGSA